MRNSLQYYDYLWAVRLWMIIHLFFGFWNIFPVFHNVHVTFVRGEEIHFFSSCKFHWKCHQNLGLGLFSDRNQEEEMLYLPSTMLFWFCEQKRFSTCHLSFGTLTVLCWQQLPLSLFSIKEFWVYVWENIMAVWGFTDFSNLNTTSSFQLTKMSNPDVISGYITSHLDFDWIWKLSEPQFFICQIRIPFLWCY